MENFNMLFWFLFHKKILSATKVYFEKATKIWNILTILYDVMQSKIEIFSF